MSPPAAHEVAPTLVEAVRRLGRHEHRGFTFLRGDGTKRVLSFGEIASECERRAGHFAALGLQKGDRLAMVVPDADEFVLSYLGAMFAGVVPVPIFPQLSFKNVDAYHATVGHIARAARASLLLTTTATRGFVEPVVHEALAARARGETDTLRALVCVEELGGAAPLLPAVDVRPEDIAFLQFTSGSTSRPKGVVVTHGNLAANAAAFMIDGVHRRSETDVGVSWLPLFHDMGLIGFVVGPLFTDIQCVFLPTASFVRAPRIWLETIHAYRGTITYAPNFAYALVAKRLRDKDVESLDLSCLRVAGCGAEPINAGTLREFARKLAPAGFDAAAFLPSYGMAEATLAITFVPSGQGLATDVVDAESLRSRAPMAAAPGARGAQELVDCGRPFPGHAIAIVDEAGAHLGDRQVGEVVTRGPSVTAGYYEEPELTAASFKGGWLHTGDLGYTVNGSLFVCGRLKDLIIVRGKNFYPSDIEWSVGELPGVRRGNVVAFSIDRDGEEHVVVAAEGSSSDAIPLRDAIAHRVAADFGLTVAEVAVIPPGALPRTSSGKPQRRKTRQMFLDGLLVHPKSVLDAPRSV